MKHAAVAGLAILGLVVCPTLATAQSVSLMFWLMTHTPYWLPAH